MVADFCAARGRADPFDDAGGLVPEDDRHWIAQRSFDHVEIGMAKAGRTDSNQHIGRLQVRRRDGFDRHRRLHGMQHRGPIPEGHQATALPESAAKAWSISAEVISHSLPKFATTARIKASTEPFALSLSPR